MSQNSAVLEAILNGPALAPPPGHVSNFDNPWNLNGIAHVTNAVCMFATISVFLTRAYAQLFCLKRIELEDAIMVICLGTYFASIGCAYRIIVTSGCFTHQWDIRLKDLASTLYVHHIGLNFCNITLALGKSAILIGWSRLFVPRGTHNSFYWIIKALLAFSALCHIAYVVAENMSCFPYRKIWDRTITEGYCIDDKTFQIPGALVSPICIAFILILPQRAIWSLQMTFKNKIGISLIFLVGILALFSSIWRVLKTFEYLESHDKTNMMSAVYLWTLAEMTCYFLAFCAPSAPRAFSNRGVIGSFLASLAVRIGFSRGPSTAKTGSHSWPSGQSHRGVKRWDASKMYRKIKDTAMPLQRYPTTFASNGQTSDDAIPAGVILMTTQFTAEITPAEDHGERNSPNREFPWAYST